ncbi:MAG: response regulator [Blastochloris sp.]|nr:response regulator [Blastochloris sp.]
MQQGGHVLVIDDDPIILDLMQRSLEDQGYTVTIESTAHTAITRALAQPPDLLLLDLMLPDLDGVELCRRIRAEAALAEVPVIMITALTNPEARLRSLEAGADDFITKPIDFIELRARVGFILRMSRYRRLLEERTQRQRAEEGMARRNRELLLLNNFITASTAQLRTSQHMGEALQNACTTLVHALDLAAAEAWLLPAEGAALLRASETSPKHPPGKPIASVIIVPEQPRLPRDPVGPLAIEVIPADLAAWLADYGDPVPLVAPIAINCGAVGAVVLLSAGERRFDVQERAFAQSLLGALSHVIETAMLNQQLQRHAEQLEEMVALRTNELQAERDRTQAILEALGEAVFVTDADCIIIYANPAATALTGYHSKELLKLSWCELEPTEGSRMLYEAIYRQVRAGQTWRGEMINSRRDGSTYDAALTVAPLFDPQYPGMTTGMVSVHRDITPLKAAERTKDTFISNVSHELRTPLSIIALHSGNLETLYARLSEEQRRRLIREVRNQAQLLDDLISDILDLSRIDSGGLLSEEQQIDLGALLSQEAAQIRPLASGKGLRLEVEVAPDLFIAGDRAQIAQCIRNLLSNAIKFTPAGGAVICACRRMEGEPEHGVWPGYNAPDAGAWAGLRVSDSGIGIVAEHLEHLFERFYRVQSQTHVPGTGLGLAITHELITRHCGWTSVASTPGQGSTFAFYLPLADAV